jgi:hypothetical protein
MITNSPSSCLPKPLILHLKTWPGQAQALKVRLIPSPPSCMTEALLNHGLLVVLHRFVDYVPLIVDTELVQGIRQDLAFAFRKNFRLNEHNAAERCREFLREPSGVQGERERLKQKLHRLALATEELTDFWSP